MVTFLAVVVRLVEDALRRLGSLCRSPKSLEVKHLFLRRQLALYIERSVRPRRIDTATRVSLVVLSKLFDWRNALVVVQPATLIATAAFTAFVLLGIHAPCRHAMPHTQNI